MLEMDIILDRQRAYFRSGATKPLSFRIESLKRLKRAIVQNENNIAQALKADLNKSAFEAYMTETGIVLDEINFAIKHLPRWIKPQRVKTPITHFLSSSSIHSEPYGVSLILSPWNYPLQLTLAPLIGSIAAGNCAVVKPSAYAPHTSSVLAKLLSETYSCEYIAVIEGGREANKALLQQKFDYIFFTGSVEVGKSVMAAASAFLTPVTLELGGKSPCIVDESAQIDLAARRIVWGKFLNAGQTCVAPDYLLVHKNIKKELLARMQTYMTQFYGENPLQNDDFPKIINAKHLSRLKGLLDQGTILAGGNWDDALNKMAPTILDGIEWQDHIMQEEIFGPLLPVIEFDDVEKVISAILDRPKPLALYLFSTDKKKQARVHDAVSFGGGCINDTIVHLASSQMPFSGVGESGMGSYHGKASFDAFSHKKSLLNKSNLLDIKLRYPPYGDNLKILKMLMK